MENCEAWAPQIRATGAVREPYPAAASSPIAMDDIAAVAATTLLTGSHEGVAHTLTGPELLTRTQLARHLADALGTPVEFLQVSRDEAVAALEPAMGENAAWYFDTILAGSAASPMPPNCAVEEITGRPATAFARWARAHVDRFR